MGDASINGVAPIAATANALSDRPSRTPFHRTSSEEDNPPTRLIDAFDPSRVYRAAASILGDGCIGLLLNRHA